MITAGSRYRSGTVTNVLLSNGQLRQALFSNRYYGYQAVTYRYRSTVDGDRFDMLAAREYGDPQLWWVLARANPEVFWPESIPAGTVLRIPDAASLR